MQYKFAFKRGSNNTLRMITGYGKESDGLVVFGDIIENALPYRAENAIKDFRSLFEEDNQKEWEDYYESICDLRIRVEREELSSLDEFERLRPYYNLTFNYSFVVKNENGINYPMQLGFCEVEPSYLQKTETDHYCIYECHSMKDGAFSILHYLFLNNYKLRRCEHCEKYFATKKLKTKYCGRYSPYKGYEDKPCGVAVDHILKKIKKRKVNILKYMGNYYPEAKPKFCEECDALLKKEKSIANLDELEYLTSKEHIKERWYKEEYK